MQIHQLLVNARKKKGLTQEQLADLTGITSRTIQRIESGETKPRPFTLKTIATALGVVFEDLLQEEPVASPSEDQKPAGTQHQTGAADSLHLVGPADSLYEIGPPDTLHRIEPADSPQQHRPASAPGKVAVTSLPAGDKHLLEILCLSCFTYLVVPMLHFLIPSHILKKSNTRNPEIITFGRKLVKTQLYWKISLWLLMFATLAYNITRAVYFEKTLLVNYLWPFFIMYFLNAIIISATLVRVKKTFSRYEMAIQLTGSH